MVSVPASRVSRITTLTLLCLASISLVLIVLAAKPLGAQLTPIDDEPGNEAPGLGHIIGSPEAGPDPEDAGDRGGWAQLALAGILFGGVVFIGSRILAESRRGRATMSGPHRDAP